jgi:hypothetical protein
VKKTAGHDFKKKIKRLSKGVRTHIRRLKQAKRRESILLDPKKKK